MAETSIEWTEKTWNPSTGCDRISPGCDNCYALKLAKRLKGMGQSKYQTDGDPRTSGPGFGLAVHPDTLGEPLRWRKPTTVFVNSMSDLFHARVPREFVVQVWHVMARTPQHTCQILTKRPERMARVLADVPYGPLDNVWLGTSIESDDYAHRADALRRVPAAKRFVSAEPLLGPLPSLDLTGVDWLIAGGESGPGSRPAEVAWVRDLRDRCVARWCRLLLQAVGQLGGAVADDRGDVRGLRRRLRLRCLRRGPAAPVRQEARWPPARRSRVEPVPRRGGVYMKTTPPVQMIRACAPSLNAGRLAYTERRVGGAIYFVGSGERCPAHDDVDAYLAREPVGECLDSYWSQQHLASLTLREVWRLWRSWRQQGGRS